MLPRTQYLPPAGEDAALWCTVAYIDGHRTREEIWRMSSKGDTYLDNRRRVSHDNGRTWTDTDSIDGDVIQDLPEGGIVTYPPASQYDTRTGILYRRLMRRIWPGNKPYTFEWKGGAHPFNDHVFMVEEDGTEQLLRYEDGPDYNPDNPFDPIFCTTNRAYAGQNIAVAEDGTAYFPMVCYRQGEDYSFTQGGVVLMRRDVSARTRITSGRRGWIGMSGEWTNRQPVLHTDWAEA